MGVALNWTSVPPGTRSVSLPNLNTMTQTDLILRKNINSVNDSNDEPKWKTYPFHIITHIQTTFKNGSNFYEWC